VYTLYYYVHFAVFSHLFVLGIGDFYAI